MSILTDSDIRSILCTTQETWNPETQLLIQDFSEECLTPMGYDLRVGDFYKTLTTKPNLVSLQPGGKVLVKPRDIALIGTLEKIRMPRNGSISAIILSKVSKVSKGLSHISTKVDPGWCEGELLVPVQNFSREIVGLQYSESFCTIIFFENKSKPSILYDSNTSRAKFFKLLAETSQSNWKKDIQLAALSIFIVGLSIAIGYSYFGNSPGFGTCVVAGVALEKIISSILSRVESK